jgi:hypothetical protein
MSGNYPDGVTDNDPHFDLPNANAARAGRGTIVPPKTSMVYCPSCMRHWEAPAREDYWNARTELCPRHQKMADLGVPEEDMEETRYPTSFQDSER